MKKIVVVVVLLVLILGVAPWGIGKIAQGRVNKGLDKLVAEAPYLSIKKNEWTGGWFRSEQTVTFELLAGWADVFKDIAKKPMASNRDRSSAEGVFLKVADEAMPEQAPEMEADAVPETPADAMMAAMPSGPLTITVHNEIMHGPVLWTSGIGLAEVRTKFEMSEEFKKGLIEAFGTDEPVKIKSRVGLFGGGVTTLYGDGHAGKTKGGTTEGSYDDFKLSIGYSGNLDKYSIDGKQPRIEVKDSADGTHFVFRDLTVDGEAKRIVGEVYDTDFKFAIGEFSGNDESKKPFKVENLHYNVSTEQKGEFVDLGLELGTGAFKSADIEQLGVDVKEVHYNFSLRRLHTDTLAKMMQKLKESYAHPLPATTAGDAEKAMFGPLKEDAIALFKHDPEIGIDRLGIVTADGEGVAKGAIKFKGVTAEDFANPMMILGKLDVEITIEAPQKMVEKFPNGGTAAGAGVDSGFIKREGDKLVCKLVYKNGALTVNGKPQPLPFGPPPPGAGMGPDGMPPGMEGMPPPKE